MTDLIFDNDDLLHLVLQHLVKEPRTFVAAGCVCKAWRAATMRDASLLMQAAGGCDFMTKRVLMGLFVLSSAEANTLPRTIRPRRAGGVMYRYDPVTVAPAAMRIVGGMDMLRLRLDKRAQDQASTEASFGEHWRELQWPKRTRFDPIYTFDTIYM